MGVEPFCICQKIEMLFGGGEKSINRSMSTTYSTQQKAVLEALRNLYEAEGVKGLREMKKYHQEFINKCVHLEREGDALEAEAMPKHDIRVMKSAFAYLRRNRREANWAAKRQEKALKPKGKAGRPIDHEKRALKKKEKLIKRMLRVAEMNQRLTTSTFKLLKRHKREDDAAAKKAAKAAKVPGKRGRPKKPTVVAPEVEEGGDLILNLLAKAEGEEAK